ncbi:uncharacterized protein BDR25DRAFT_63862 [Lindgomyces ingoldianus]|uniref:Uncharacterized protein n=1 Tax=Lindgomyces ingoldianus TaxID=673940 RepID=A0ACB6QN69_9PLEO|nr:uncharacterized protein BDR25DRAFT_63862 [Lindgomyces ingoldianus]KAF2467572.1 hypothetical protein BDR25DRAFT_63862 [Lindgomyces ingoldianus]
MSLARAVTKRMKRPDVPAPPPARAQSMKNPGLHIDRAKISSPVALISTTNMLSYNAPDIATLRQVSSSTSSTHSADDSDHSASTNRSRSSSNGSRETLTDASSVDSSPTSTTPAPNHLSGYFASAGKAPRRSVSSGNLQHKSEQINAVPAIPERAISHSKRAHERLAQKRSLQNIKPRSSLHSNRSSREHRTSMDMFRGTIEEEAHPFGKELEQLNEVAEEFGGVVRDAEMDADMTAIREKGLATFCAADYLAEIKPLFSGRFGNPYTPSPIAWI